MTDSRALDTNQRTNTTPGVSRREFVLAASAAAALPSLAGGFLSNVVPERRRESATLRIGLIGCGGRGTGAAVQALRADSNCELVAMGDVFSDRLENCLKGVTAEMGDEAPAKVKVDPDRRFVGFDSYQKVIDSGVDVVLLCSYPAFRPAHLKAAVQAGKHIFAEKPLAVDGPGLRSVLESAAEAKRKNLGVVVGFCWRYNDGMKATFGELAKGTIGDIVNVQTTYLTGTLGKRPRKPEWTDLEFQMRNWWHFPWISGDHIVEQAVHSIDRLSWAVGDRLPKRVICLGGSAARTGPESGASYDHFAAVYEYDGGMRTFHTCRQIDSCPNDNTDYVWGLKGSAVINGWAPTYSLRDVSGREVWKYTGPNDRDMYQTEHDELFASLRAGTPINDCERGANSTLMAIMARMAAYTGQTISWEQALNSKESLVPEHLEFGPFPFPELAVPGKTKFV
ncbi:MAG: Gfo/Idh/MocA family oxidoreductase [Phycisphaerae bacterium]|nr:Gfo/Idh/MocA family oxidoreductase [Phycisphaerae bacterium]